MGTRSNLRARNLSAIAIVCTCGAFVGCSDDDGYSGGGDGAGAATQVGTFDGLFDGVADGINFGLDLAIVPADPTEPGDIHGGDVLVANYGTSELLRVADPSGAVQNRTAQAFYDGSASGLAGAMGVGMTPDGHVWAAFEQGGDGNEGAVVVLSSSGEELEIFDGSTEAGAFARPGGICYGGTEVEPALTRMFFINMGDGTAWRIEASSSAGASPAIVRVGQGLATGTAGNPGTPSSPIGSNDLPEDGARGCAYHAGALYVADAQNQRVVRFDAADTAEDATGVALENTPSELLTYPTGVSINNEGALIVISYDNAHAFVALQTPNGGFLDNGLYDLNVNSGNHGVQVAHDTIWFTRANNTNGTLRAITADQQHPPSTAGDFPVQ